MRTCNWQSFSFQVWPRASSWNEVSGIYFFCKQTVSGWEVLYVGQTTALRSDLANHKKWNAAVALGFTHVHFLRVAASADQRNRMEEFFLKKLNPLLNAYHAPAHLLSQILAPAAIGPDAPESGERGAPAVREAMAGLMGLFKKPVT